MKIIHSVDEIIEDGKLITDLVDLDLSNLDLSSYDASTWNHDDYSLILNVNFSNTNIKFNPQLVFDKSDDQLRIVDCDFTNCDLSHLTTKDFEGVLFRNNNNFTNTNLNINLHEYAKLNDIDIYYELADIIPSYLVTEAYQGHDIHDLDICAFSLEDLMNKKNIKLTSSKLLYVLQKEKEDIYKNYYRNGPQYLDSLMELLSLDGDGDFNKLYNIIDPKNYADKLLLLTGTIKNREFDKVDLSDMSYDFTNMLKFINCTFENLTLPYTSISRISPDFDEDCNIKKVYIKDMNFSSWQDDIFTRISDSHVTFKVNLYLELRRLCNCNCKFCRNKCLEDVPLDIENIKKNLNPIRGIADNIVIGGGEPTLFMKELHEISRYIEYVPNKTIITNGSASLEDYYSLIDEGFSIELSRHAIKLEDNLKVLNPNKDVKIIDDVYYLSRATYSNHTDFTLCITCFKGGIDNFEDIIKYISWADNIYYVNSLLFQSIHQDLDSKEENSDDDVFDSKKENIDDDLFDKVIEYYYLLGASVSSPIYSSGNYKLIIVEYRSLKISFKKYIPYEELVNNWYISPKRTFDLSMDPSGNIYENWNQNNGKVLYRGKN
jgi:pyruvate-formate lyase-activating enzyme